MSKKLIPLALAMLVAGMAGADEADIKKAMEAKLRTKVESVSKAGYLGLYEVYSAEEEIYYTDEKMTAIIVGGQLFDTKTTKNVTQERVLKRNAIKFAQLPFERAIKQVRGDGKRVIATFEDPNCGFCKTLAKEIRKLDNITVYTFLYPILSEDSLKKSKQIWCASDRAKAWNDWMVDGRAPSGKDDCDTSAILKNAELAQSMKINGTPAVLFASGERVPGAMTVAKIEQMLGQTK